MIGDKIELNTVYLETAKSIFKEISKSISFSKNAKITIGIGGESGSGKSISAFALQNVLKEQNISSLILQQDDYFLLPPKTNHNNRLLSLNNVGLQEVNLDLIEQNILDFKSGADYIEKPLVNYTENTITSEIYNTENVDVLIIEGTYVLGLPNLDYRIFIVRNYKETHQNRINRNREEITDFIEKVLEIEHQIIKKYKSNADLILDQDYNIKTNSNKN